MENWIPFCKDVEGYVPVGHKLYKTFFQAVESMADVDPSRGPFFYIDLTEVMAAHAKLLDAKVAIPTVTVTEED